MLTAREELQRLLSVLSEYECKHLLSTARDIAAGERFWEGDIGILYNEYVKIRYRQAGPPSAEAEVDTGIFAAIPLVKCYPRAQRIQLPAPDRLNAELSEVLSNRRSRRDYSGASISLLQVSTLLQYACGTTGFSSGYDYNRFPFRTFPSSGGLQSPEVYLFVNAVDSLPCGLYHYHPIDHVLECLKGEDYRSRLRTFAFDQSYLETSALVFAITGCYERLRWKYEERAYRYICMDAGFLAENLYLVAEALGFGACATSGFAEDSMQEILEIDGKDEIVLLLVTVGALRHDDSNSNPP